MTLCLIGIHKWEYYNQSVMTTHSLKHIISSDMVVNLSMRMCNRCMKKEFKPNNFTDWKKYDKYTIEEKRQIQLKKILGKDQ